MHKALKGKIIVLGVSGGIAAYKSVELVRLLTKEGAAVRVLMTRNACEFVGPLTFEALSDFPVSSSLFEKGDEGGTRHIDWAEAADAVVIAPATANIIGKLANGIADDALSTFMMAVTSPVMVCPSMNSNMLMSKAVQRNIETLEEDGFRVLTPGAGELACGTSGPGRLPEPAEIVDRLGSFLTPKDMAGKTVLVTAGPTREPLDPVRFISNPSSGKMGYAIARAAENRGGRVILVSGPTVLPDPANITTIRVETAREMADAVFAHMDDAHVIIKTAAVSDYSPTERADHKIKKEEEGEAPVLRLKKNRDILKALGERKGNRILVGFAAETEALDKNAGKKLIGKNLDMIAGNLVGRPDSGFGSDSNVVTLYSRDGTREPLEAMEKDALAHVLLDRILGLNPGADSARD